MELVEAGKYAEGCDKLAASLKLNDGLGTRFKLAICREKNGQLATAWGIFSEAASIAEQKKDPRAKKAEEDAKRLAERVSKLTIIVPGKSKVPGLRVTRTNVNVPNSRLDIVAETWGSALPIDGGEYLIEASAPGRKPLSKQVKVAIEKDNVLVTIETLEEDPSNLAVSPPPAASSNSAPRSTPVANSGTSSTLSKDDEPKPLSTGSTQRALAYASGGIGIVGVAVGTYFGLHAKSRLDASKATCDANGGCSSHDGKIALDEANSSATLSTVFFGVGIAGIGAGVALYVTAPSAKQVGVTNLTLSTTAQNGLNGVALSGNWQ